MRVKVGDNVKVLAEAERNGEEVQCVGMLGKIVAKVNYFQKRWYLIAFDNPDLLPPHQMHNGFGIDGTDEYPTHTCLYFKARDLEVL